MATLGTKKNKMRIMEMDFLRRAAGISRREGVRKERIREIMRVDRDIIEEIEKRQLIWYGHVQRMEEERLPKMTMKWQPKERRKRGGPRPGWNAGITRIMIVWKLPPEGWENREEWKKILGTERPKERSRNGRRREKYGNVNKEI
ncbi:hypothetical protein L798_07477 [Zootermopsis nevadensis]|uniref:Uncharacterized protein n=1 Tax=Zootermopsis nevadensis TaxID=136037 RepID=A0A067RH33_ZOONE|nr:hypothetical protein L798_07477 [Zootermopsis nevadensis]